MKLLLLPTFLALAVCDSDGGARADTGRGAGAASTAPAPPSNVPSPPPDYVYAPDGRRDPFVSLVNRGAEKPEKPVVKARPDGIGGVSVDDVVVRGLVAEPRRLARDGRRAERQDLLDSSGRSPVRRHGPDDHAPTRSC